MSWQNDHLCNYWTPSFHVSKNILFMTLTLYNPLFKVSCKFFIMWGMRHVSCSVQCGRLNTPPLNRAQVKNKCREKISMALFMSDQADFKYVKIKTFHLHTVPETDFCDKCIKFSNENP